MDTLNSLVFLYPSLLRPVQNPIHKLSLNHLSGAFPSTTSSPLIEAAARLQATLHLTAGKAGGANAWRKTMDGALGTAEHCLYTLRSTFFSGEILLAHNYERHTNGPASCPGYQTSSRLADPSRGPYDCCPSSSGQAPLHGFTRMPTYEVSLDASRAHTLGADISNRTPILRPAPAPLGALARLCLDLLRAPSELSVCAQGFIWRLADGLVFISGRKVSTIKHSEASKQLLVLKS